MSKLSKLTKLHMLCKEYKAIDDKMNSSWCDSTWRCKEGYGELGRIRRDINETLKELET